MTDEPFDLLALARANLGAARRDLGADDPRFAVSRAYYAAFHAASAALLSEGVDPRSHKGTHTQFARVFLRDGRLPRTLGPTFVALSRLRQDADYHVGSEIDMEVARGAVSDAESFVDRIAVWLASRADDAPTDDAREPQ